MANGSGADSAEDNTMALSEETKTETTDADSPASGLARPRNRRKRLVPSKAV